MKKVLVLGVIAAMLSACGGTSQGELVGVQEQSEYRPADPYGMVLIPRGTYNMGANDQNVPYAHTTAMRTVTMHAYFMDQTEVTNNEYRQFVYWVRDSIARTLLADALVEGYEYIEEDRDGEPLDKPVLDWKPGLDYGDDDEEIMEALESMYLPEEERIFGKKEFDPREWAYTYSWLDKSSAASKENRYDVENGTYREGYSRQGLVKTNEVLVYPDTLAWIHDYSYTFNEPMFDTYFWHPAYGDYPVVGVDWNQATAFANWRSDLLYSSLSEEQQSYETRFRLPTETEWEYAARGGREQSMYPWGGPYSRNSQGCFLANFKPLRGNYIADGYAFTSRTDAFWPNDYGLYCMSGNVSEWTATPFEPTVGTFLHDMNPEYTYNADENAHPKLKRKVVKGGSWKDVGAYLQIAARDYEYQDTTKSYIGFRCVKTYPLVKEVTFK